MMELSLACNSCRKKTHETNTFKCINCGLYNENPIIKFACLFYYYY